MNVSLTLLVVAEDQRYGQFDPKYIKVLWENGFPSIILTDSANIEDLMNECLTYYLRFNPNWIQKHLVDFKIVGNMAQVIYKCTIPYIENSLLHGEYVLASNEGIRNEYRRYLSR